MHRLMAGVTILEHELSELRLLVERQTGILLDCPNSALAAHVADYLERNDMEAPSALLSRFRSPDLDPCEVAGFLDGILNVTTGFFRHPGAMNALARQVIPQIYARKSNEGPATLRIWSTGCATGEEPYSIAMAVCEALANNTANAAANGANGNGGKESKSAGRNGGISENSAPPSSNGLARDWSIHIVGTDLLPSSIQVAERGLYPQSALAGLPPAAIRACFSKIGSIGTSAGAQDGTGNGGGSAAASVNGNGSAFLLVKPRLRSLVTFNTMNLTKPVYIGRFDCIFCMDVLPHLSRTQRAALMERLHLYLEPGGYLFLSQTEKLCAPNLNFRPETYDGYTFYRKPLAAAAAYGR
ncbi:MAG TPA: CheR family methyltransferase [Candidatus Sulfotelmatobacter sp.]|nr:CheR family methyltransferase [Candidatus Sulfotelmatobacter sp.]